jgi:hypothetical protein
MKAGTAVETLEEAVHLLRRVPAGAVAAYFTGSVPFLAGFLFFWTEMSRSRNADAECFAEAFGVAALFVWMSWWKAIFAGRLRRLLEGSAEPPWTWERIWRVLAVQSSIQPLKLVAVPVAAIAMLPAAVTCAFFRNVTALADSDGSEPGEVVKQARRQASLWQRQNWGALGVLFLFALVVFLNLALTLAALPQLVRILTGYESAFARSGPSFVLNSTFFAVAAGITWLCIDPFIQVLYVLRCFLGQAVRTGEDLKAELRRLSQAAALLLIAVVLFAGRASAREGLQPRAASHTLSADELDRSIDEAMAQREYQWRLLRRATVNHGFAATFVRFTEDAVRLLNRGARFVAESVSRFFRWLRGLFSTPADSRQPGSAPSGLLRLSLWLLALLAAGGAVALLLRRGQRERSPGAGAATAAVDLNDESVLASQLPEEAWLALAEEWIGKQDLRMALRALYLGTLAYLGRRGLVTIHSCKSNREYETELRRRARAAPEVPPLFRWDMGRFEESWYGSHEVLAGDIERFRENLERMKLISASAGGTP